MAAHFKEMLDKSEYTFAEIMSSLAEKFPDIPPQDLSGKVVIVTGANVGIGYETAKALASMKPKLLILAVRNLAKGNEALQSIQKSTGFSGLEVVALDLASFASVKAFAQSFLKRNLPLDLLVSNAGIVSHDWVLTQDGHEVQLQVNHLANMLLVLLLTPALRQAAHPRVVVVASDTHFWASRPAPDDPTPITTLSTKPEVLFFSQYPSTKLLNVLFAQEFARRCPYPIWICSANPSLTRSELGTKDPISGDHVSDSPNIGWEPRPTPEGSKTIIYAAISPEAKTNGGYYSEVRERHTRSSTKGEVGKQFARNVWKESVGIISKVVEPGTFEAWVAE